MEEGREKQEEKSREEGRGGGGGGGGCCGCGWVGLGRRGGASAHAPGSGWGECGTPALSTPRPLPSPRCSYIMDNAG